MLLYFSVENFRSIKERVALDLRPAPRLRRHPSHVVSLEMNNKKSQKALRSSVIFGANASGKSNIVKAIRFAKRLIVNPSVQSGLKTEPFRLDSTINDVSSFYFEFSMGGQIYIYSFSLSSERIFSEMLYVQLSFKDLCIYERVYNVDEDKYDISTDLLDGDIIEFFKNDAEKIEKLNTIMDGIRDLITLLEFTSDKQLFLNESGVKKIHEKLKVVHSFIYPAFHFFKNSLVVVFPDSYYAGIHRDFSREDISNNYVNLLSKYDTGINDIKVDNVDISIVPDRLLSEVESKLKNQESTTYYFQGRHVKFEKDDEDNIKAYQIVSERKLKNGSSINFELCDESDGTNRLLDLLPSITSPFKEQSLDFYGRTYVVDEFDRSLHPNISKNMIQTFLEGEFCHPQDQLIITTHESNLLDNELFRRDEIWFVQKEDDFSTSLYSLNDYSTRFDKDIRKAYLDGIYGAVPYIMDNYKR
ncbi:AAA family ATPase [Vibrio fluvialis]|nr:AAA family ATPase [Vibrio fluvialis]